MAICKRRNISLDGEAAVIRLPTILGGKYRYRRGSRSVYVRIARKFSRMPTCHHHYSTLQLLSSKCCYHVDLTGPTTSTER